MKAIHNYSPLAKRFDKNKSSHTKKQQQKGKILKSVKINLEYVYFFIIFLVKIKAKICFLPKRCIFALSNY